MLGRDTFESIMMIGANGEGELACSRRAMLLRRMRLRWRSACR